MTENQPSLTRQEAPDGSNNSVVARTVIVGALVLSGLFVFLLFFKDNFEGFFGKWADEVTVGLMLFSLWIVVGSVVRSVNNLAKGAGVLKLLLAGVLTATIAAALGVAFMALAPKIAKSANIFEVAGASGGMILVLSAIAFLVSLVAIINVRVRNRQLGNLLELILIGGSIALFVYFASK